MYVVRIYFTNGRVRQFMANTRSFANERVMANKAKYGPLYKCATIWECV